MGCRNAGLWRNKSCCRDRLVVHSSAKTNLRVLTFYTNSPGENRGERKDRYEYFQINWTTKKSQAIESGGENCIALNHSPYFLKLPKRSLCTDPPTLPSGKIGVGAFSDFSWGEEVHGTQQTEWREPFDFFNWYFQFCYVEAKFALHHWGPKYLSEFKKKSTKHCVKWKVIRRPYVKTTHCCDHLQWPHVRRSKTVLIWNSTPWIPDLFQWNLDSGFQSLVGYRIPWAAFRIPKNRILDSTASICWIPDSTSKNFPDSGIRVLLHRWHLSFCLPFSFVISVCHF